MGLTGRYARADTFLVRHKNHLSNRLRQSKAVIRGYTIEDYGS